jgi:hypothetical protein
MTENKIPRSGEPARENTIGLGAGSEFSGGMCNKEFDKIIGILKYIATDAQHKETHP